MMARPFLTLLILALLGVSAESQGAGSRCGAFFANLGRSIVKQQRDYWLDVGRTRGLRFLRAPRAERAKFNHWVWLDPIAYPITIPPEIFRWRYTPSVPVVVAASAAGVTAAEQWQDKRAESALAKAGKHDPAARYLYELQRRGFLPESGRELARRYREAKGLSGPAGRRKELARQTPEAAERLGDFLSVPAVSFGTVSDLEIAAAVRGVGQGSLAPLGPVFKNLGALGPLATISVGLASLDREAVQRRINAWREEFPEEEGVPSFLGRAEVPAQDLGLEGVELPFRSGPLSFANETSVWRQIWTDPRLADLKEDFLSGGLDEMAALRVFRQKADAYAALEKIIRAEGPLPLATACALAMGRAPGAAVLFEGPAENYLNRMNISAGSPRAAGCRVLIVNELKNFYRAEPEALGTYREVLLEALEEALASGATGCGTPVVRCP